MDLTKLTPAPWGYCYDGSHDWSVGGEQDPQERLNVCGVSGSDGWARAHCEFIALARNAFDVMMRRGWWASLDNPHGHNQWVVEGMDFFFDYPDAPACEWLDPFTALVEADKWYKENVEKENES